MITGASRGIGREIALRAARDGAKVIIAAKTDKPHPKLPGTIHTVAEEVEEAGGEAHPIAVDIRDDEAAHEAVLEGARVFGGIDILVNNASAIFLAPTEETPMKRFDLLFSCNVRGTYLLSKECLTFLKESENPHILNLSPPLNMDPKWFKDHLPYTMSKYGMSMCTLGMSAEFLDEGIAVNSLWPKTTINTSAVQVFFPDAVPKSRDPAIMADAAHAILTKDSRTVTGNFFIDEDLLSEEGTKDFSSYAVNPKEELQLDLYLD